MVSLRNRSMRASVAKALAACVDGVFEIETKQERPQ